MAKLPKATTEPDKLFERPPLKSFIRLMGFLLVLMLNISLIGSVFSSIQTHQRINFQLEASSLLLLLFVDSTILLPLLFEVGKVRFWADRIGLNTLFWKTELAWSDILELSQPSIFAVAVIKTKGMIYIIHRRDFKEYPEIIEKIEGKIGVAKKKT
ncbi:MAG TPA: hypothetical protein V6C97_23505 [Oculatellaceae cyanobacterium]